VKKIVKIGPVITEIALLIVKKKKYKEEIPEGKIYSPVGNLAERTKLEMCGKAQRIAGPAEQCRPVASNSET